MTAPAVQPILGAFPADGTSAEKFGALLHYAIQAPSSHNSQPWLFSIDATCLELYADRSRALAVVDPDDRELVMSCGAALFCLRAAARRFGLTPVAIVCPEPDNPDLLARVTLGERTAPLPEDEELFHAIPARRTNRQRFADRDVPADILERLRLDAASEGAWLEIVTADRLRHLLADLIARGDEIQAADKRFRRELAAWIHPNRSRSRDGMPGYAFGFGDLLSHAGPALIRTFDWGSRQAARDRQIALGSPVLAVLGTADDRPSAWVVAGQTLARVSLRAAAAGVSVSFLNQPIEVRELRPQVVDILGRKGYPQLVLRMGYGPVVNPTPRRPVREVLL